MPGVGDADAEAQGTAVALLWTVGAVWTPGPIGLLRRLWLGLGLLGGWLLADRQAHRGVRQARRQKQRRLLLLPLHPCLPVL